jgi:uracil-DNA glycosylase
MEYEPDMIPFNIEKAHPSWHKCLHSALATLDPAYLTILYHNNQWLPGPENIFNAFSVPVEKINYVLFGESPYPRKQSANGYAFWDQAVTELWTVSGMSKPVNRATSLRNIIKTLLVAEGLLDPKQTSQDHIAQIEKKHLVQTNADLFQNFIKHGFLLLNATPVLQLNNVRKDAKAWQAFIHHVLHFLCQHRPDVQLILLGNIANDINKVIPSHCLKKLYAEHPYNHSFIENKVILEFFAPLHLLIS